jgi:hypothetical protein
MIFIQRLLARRKCSGHRIPSIVSAHDPRSDADHGGANLSSAEAFIFNHSDRISNVCAEGYRFFRRSHFLTHLSPSFSKILALFSDVNNGGTNGAGDAENSVYESNMQNRPHFSISA